jgi:hypothetical protein
MVNRISPSDYNNYNAVHVGLDWVKNNVSLTMVEKL